jgi:hypothetical protein
MSIPILYYYFYLINRNRVLEGKDDFWREIFEGELVGL